MKRKDIIVKLAEYLQSLTFLHPLRVGIDGVDAAGKTTLAGELAVVIKGAGREVIRASIDGFHNPEHIRRQQGDLSPKGFYQDSFNYAGAIEALLAPLGPGGNRQYITALFNHRKNQSVQTPIQTAAEDAILLMDGIFLLRPELRPYWDVTLYLQVNFSNTIPRGVARDTGLYGSPEKATTRYLKRYVPGQELYHADAHPLDTADIIIDNNNLEKPEILKFPNISVLKKEF